MARLHIRIDYVRTLAQQLERSACRVSQAAQQLSLMRSRVDTAIQSRRDIGRRLQIALQEAQDTELRLRQLASFLQEAASRYSDVEDALLLKAANVVRADPWSSANHVVNRRSGAGAALDIVPFFGEHSVEGVNSHYYTDRQGNKLPIHVEQLQALLDDYNQATGILLHPPFATFDVAVDATPFFRYVIERGYDPRTFQPLNASDTGEIEGYIIARQQIRAEERRKTAEWQSELLEWIPGVSVGKQVADLLAGKDIITGEKLSTVDYAMAPLSFFGPLGKLGKKALKLASGKFFGKADDAVKAAGSGSKIVSSVDDLSNAAKSKITTSQRATLNQQERTYSHLSEMDLKGARRDLDGQPVPKPGGGHYDHAQEVSDAYRGLVDLKSSWDGILRNPKLDTELRQLYTSKSNEVNITMKKIEDMFAPHGGVYPPK